jgi:hypothetical protein
MLRQTHASPVTLLADHVKILQATAQAASLVKNSKEAIVKIHAILDITQMEITDVSNVTQIAPRVLDQVL